MPTRTPKEIFRLRLLTGEKMTELEYNPFDLSSSGVLPVAISNGICCKKECKEVHEIVFVKPCRPCTVFETESEFDYFLSQVKSILWVDEHLYVLMGD